MRFRNCSKAAIALALPLLAPADNSVLAIAPAPKVTGPRQRAFTVKTTVTLRSGYHVNSNIPTRDNIIPLRLTWSSGPVEVQEVVYPKPRLEKYAFYSKPLSVFTGDFDLLPYHNCGGVVDPYATVDIYNTRYFAPKGERLQGGNQFNTPR